MTLISKNTSNRIQTIKNPNKISKTFIKHLKKLSQNNNLIDLKILN
jgi:hypothetical protein